MLCLIKVDTARTSSAAFDLYLVLREVSQRHTFAITMDMKLHVFAAFDSLIYSQ